MEEMMNKRNERMIKQFTWKKGEQISFSLQSFTRKRPKKNTKKFSIFLAPKILTEEK